MESSNWFKGIIDQGEGCISSSFLSPAEDRDRRLREEHNQAINCPRCNSSQTKFCYYNNYSLSQPRHYCKTCRRYWTKGGSLRNIPIGGGCHKKRSSRTKKQLHGGDHQPLVQSQPVMEFKHCVNEFDLMESKCRLRFMNESSDDHLFGFSMDSFGGHGGEEQECSRVLGFWKEMMMKQSQGQGSSEAWWN
ncbi:hypothetical protein J5N97_027991 [Dioscorea zingiberensis]|uniref:Dof zinc finger protein n=1 Tax=Dioscorea zingiberensis TaxID=325984 RepID=A0A9D5H4H1_9LILI|nr:hypothetical protein J5N97_027991 [Dioscorea zingiberensis]